MANAAALLEPLFVRASADVALALRSILRATVADLLHNPDAAVTTLPAAERAFAAAVGKARALSALLGGLDTAIAVDSHGNPQQIVQQFADANDPVWLDVPFEEAIEAYAQQRPVLAGLVPELKHAYSPERLFWVAKAATAQITARVKDVLGDVLADGATLPEFRDALEAVAPSAAAWSDAYLGTVMRTNLADAYQHGREAQAERLGDFVVGFEYANPRDGDSRANHAAADGIIFGKGNTAVADLLRTPRGFNCRCSQRIITRPEAEDRGILEALREGKIVLRDGSVADSVPPSALPTAAELEFLAKGAAA